MVCLEKNTTARKTRHSTTIRHDSDTVAEGGGQRRLMLLVKTLFIGALGSGVWELLLRDSFGWFRLRVLDVLSFGISALYVGTYTRVGSAEQGQISLLGYLLLTWLFVVFGASEIQNLLGLGLRTPSGRKTVCLCLSLYILMSGCMVGQSARAVYIRDAKAHYQVLLDVCAPFMDDHEYKLKKSKFAQVRSRADYDEVVESLEEIARSNNQYFRPFARW